MSPQKSLKLAYLCITTVTQEMTLLHHSFGFPDIIVEGGLLTPMSLPLICTAM